MADENNACDSIASVAQIVLFAMYASNGRTLTTIITFVKASCYVISHVICNFDHVHMRNVAAYCGENDATCREAPDPV